MNTRPLLLILSATFAATACSEIDTDAVRTVPPPTSTASTTPTPTDRSVPGSSQVASSLAPEVSDSTVDSTPAASDSTAPTTIAAAVSLGDPQVAATFVASFEQPVGLAVRPGDTAIYVVEQDGRIMRAELRFGGAADQRVVIDLTDATGADAERGLLGLAFAATGDRAWVHYTDNDGDTVVAEYPVAPDGTFAAAGRTVLAVDQPYANHNGGDLAVGPDGMLYVALGDGGSGGDPERRASDPTDLLGKLLRIDPSAGSPYGIPPDNPFATGTGPGGVDGAPEVWSWGLRNPWRIAFDPANGDLWIADVGQSAWEEIDHVLAADGRPAGWAADFGWSAYEGDVRFNDDVDDPGNLVFPVHVYEHGADGCSVSGGAVYRGPDIPALVGMYVYSDYCSGKLWAYAAATDRNLTLLDSFEQVTAVRAGPDGELYVLEQGGDVYRIDPAT